MSGRKLVCTKNRNWDEDVPFGARQMLKEVKSPTGFLLLQIVRCYLKIVETKETPTSPKNRSWRFGLRHESFVHNLCLTKLTMLKRTFNRENISNKRCGDIKSNAFA